jgi:hypothetical protein
MIQLFSVHLMIALHFSMPSMLSIIEERAVDQGSGVQGRDPENDQDVDRKDVSPTHTLLFFLPM